MSQTVASRAALLAGLVAPPGRGLLLLTDRAEGPALQGVVDGLGLVPGEWSD